MRIPRGTVLGLVLALLCGSFSIAHADPQPAPAPAAAATPATGTGAAAGGAAANSCPAPTTNPSYDSKASLASNATSLNKGQFYGPNQQCAALVQSQTNVGSTTTWSPGSQVQGNCSSIPVGTVVATFNGPGQTYNTKEIYGHQHTGLFMGCNSSGMMIEDQYIHSNGVQTHTIPWDAWGKNTAEGGSKFYVVDSPTGKGNGSSGSASSPSTPASTGAAADCPTTKPADTKPADTKTPATTPPPTTTPPATTPPAGQGATGTANPTSTTPPAQQPVTPTGNAQFPVGDPSYCWICDAAITGMNVIQVLASSGANKVASDIWPLATGVTMIALLWRILVALVEGGNPMRGMATFLGRFMIVSAVVGAMATASGPVAGGSASGSLTDSNDQQVTLVGVDGQSSGGSGSTDVVTDYLIYPAIAGGSQFGSDLATAAAGVVGVQTAQTSNCQHATIQSASSGGTSLSDAATALVGLVCNVHVAGNYGIAMGAAVTSGNYFPKTLMDTLGAILFAIAGVVMMYMAFNMMLAFGFGLFEALVKLAIAVAFLPFFMVAWLFETTRSMAYNALRGFLFAFVFLSATGVASIVSILVMAKAVSLGLGSSGGTLDPVQLNTQMVTFAQGLDVTNAGSYGSLVKLFGFFAVGFMMAGRVLDGTQKMAAQLTGYQQGKPGQMATAGEAFVRRVGSVGIGALTVVAAAGTAALSKLGRGVVRAFFDTSRGRAIGASLRRPAWGLKR